MNDLTIIKTVDSTGEAEAICTMLSSAGIKTMIQTTENGGMVPAVAGRDVQILVSTRDAFKALELFKTKGNTGKKCC